MIKDKPIIVSNSNFKFSSLLSTRNASSYPYSELLCLGSFINTNIYTFTNYNCVNKKSLQNVTKFILPKNPNESNVLLKSKTKSIIKMIKYLTSTFPNYSAEFFVYHIFFRSGLNSDVNNGFKENNLLKINLSDIKNQITNKKLKNLDSINMNAGKKKSPISNGKNTVENNFTATNSKINIGNINVTTQNNVKINGLSKDIKTHHSMTNIVDSYYEGKINMNNRKIKVADKRVISTRNSKTTVNINENVKKESKECVGNINRKASFYSNDNGQKYPADNDSNITPKNAISGRNYVNPTLMNKIIYSSQSVYGKNSSKNSINNTQNYYNTGNKLLDKNLLKFSTNEKSEISNIKNKKIKSVSKPNICFTDFNFITNPLYMNEVSLEEIEDNFYDYKSAENYEKNNPNEKDLNKNPSSNIFVVARDDKIRFRTDFDADSIDTIEDHDTNTQINVNNKLDNIDITLNSLNNASYNTPTKKKIFRYYS